MHETSKQLLNLMFRSGETICVSPNQFGYHAIPLEVAMSSEVTLVPTQKSCDDRNAIRISKGLPALTWEEYFEQCPTDKLLLVALNPIKGFRLDSNTVAFRNYLIELDYGTTEEQLNYIKQLGMPYSAAIFSGGKSVHFLVSLDKDLPSEKVYRLFAEWTLQVATLSDPNCKNPSRSIRMPGAERDPGKFQKLLEFNGPVKLTDFVNWLNKHPEARPKEREKRVISPDGYDFSKIKPWARKALLNGLDPTKSRNKQWFAIACEFALAGYSEDDTISILENYYIEDRDFKRKEWLKSVEQGFKYMYDNNR